MIHSETDPHYYILSTQVPNYNNCLIHTCMDIHDYSEKNSRLSDFILCNIADKDAY